MSETRFIETLVVRSLVAELLNAGCQCSIPDEDDATNLVVNSSRSLEEIVAGCLNIFDECSLEAENATHKDLWVRLHLGNGTGILGDYEMDVEPLIPQTLAFIEAITDYHGKAGSFTMPPLPVGVEESK